jgi:hypothetical protein
MCDVLIVNFLLLLILLLAGNGYIREYPVPVGNRYGYSFLSVAGNRHKFGYVT